MSMSLGKHFAVQTYSLRVEDDGRMVSTQVSTEPSSTGASLFQELLKKPTRLGQEPEKPTVNREERKYLPFDELWEEARRRETKYERLIQAYKKEQAWLTSRMDKDTFFASICPECGKSNCKSWASYRLR